MRRTRLLYTAIVRQEMMYEYILWYIRLDGKQDEVEYPAAREDSERMPTAVSLEDTSEYRE